MLDSIHYSGVSRWLRCGVQYEYILSGLRIPPGITARRGTSVHKAAEFNHKAKIRTGWDEPLDVLTDLAVETLKEYVQAGNYFLPPSQKDRRKAFEQETEAQVLGAVRVYHGEIAPAIRPRSVEQRLNADLGFGIPIQGTTDVVDETGVIVDLKVMKTKNQAWADRELQPTFYHFLEAENTGVWPEGFHYHLMVPNKTVKHLKIETRRTPRDIELLKHYIGAYLADMQSGLFKPADPTHWICSPEYCGYFQICKFSGGQRQLNPNRLAA